MVIKTINIMQVSPVTYFLPVYGEYVNLFLNCVDVESKYVHISINDLNNTPVFQCRLALERYMPTVAESRGIYFKILA